MKIAVVGTGYVGLVSGVCLAARGHDVTCLDVAAGIIERINRAQPHIYERGLEPLLARVVKENRFRAALASPGALKDCRIIMLAVGTPSVDGRIDLAQVESACQLAGAHLRVTSSPCSIIVKSTVVPGTTDTAVRGWLEAAAAKRLGQFGLGMNPEFLREGEAVTDFMEPDRIVMGCETEETWQHLQELYAPWSCDKLRVNTRTAEMIKYANNTLLATQISAANELANVAAALGGIDIHQVMEGVHADKRWNPLLPGGHRAKPAILTYLWPGCGFGGSCFPKDLQALRATARDAGEEPRLLSAVLAVNDDQPRQVLALLKRAAVPLQGHRVLVLGLAFKPETDDVRESACRRVLQDLQAEGALVAAHDPMAMDNARKAWPELSPRYVQDWQAEVAVAEIVIVATAWAQYLTLREAPLRDQLRHKVLFDARRRFQPQDFPESVYFSIGHRPRSKA